MKVYKFNKKHSKYKNFVNLRYLAYLLILVGFILILIAIGLKIRKNSYPKPPPGSLTSKNAPSSVKINKSSILSYEVPPNNPKYISIPAINISKTQILKLGITNNNAIAVPNNIYQTGWYDQSSKPGQLGAMFIYGHISSWTADGIFYNLHKLVKGDKIIIIAGNNKSYTYQVMFSRVYPYNKVNMSQVLSPLNPKIPGLNLMTCDGSVIRGTSEFNKRLVVFSSLVKN